MNAKMTVAGLCCGAIWWAMPALVTGAVISADQKFINSVAQTDMLEAHLGQMAQDRGGRQSVKDYGQMLVTDHTNDYQQISTLAAKSGASIPKGLDTPRNKMIAPFSKLKGTSFDRRYIREMIVGHTKAIAEYKHEAADGKNDSLKDYAKQALPTLEKHLHQAETLEKSKK